MQKKLLRASPLLLALLAGASQAAVDVSAATTALTTDGSAAISLVGNALITLAGIAVVYKWVKASFFG